MGPVRLSIVISLLVCCCEALSVGGPVRRVTEGSQVTLQCRMPVGRVIRVLDPFDSSTSSSSLNVMPVIWLRFDMEDPNNQEVISHGDTLLIDNPRLNVDFDEKTGKSVLTIDPVRLQDSGSYQCQVPMESEAEIISSTPIEVIIEVSTTTTEPTGSATAVGSSWLLIFTLVSVYI